MSVEFREVRQRAEKAEKLALSDPRGACFWARLTLEAALNTLYRRDPDLRPLD